MFHICSMIKSVVILTALAGLASGLGACCKAGSGGNATVNVSVYDANSHPIQNVTVYVKYGQSTAPSATTSGYDDHKQSSGYGNTVSFTGLKCGTYYFYAIGYDSAVKLPITGGGPYSLKHSNRNKTERASLSISY